MGAAEDAVVAHDPGGSRWTIAVEGEVVGELVYVDRGERRIVTHTAIDDAHGGKGLAGRLVADVVAEHERAGPPIVPLCPYVAGWLERHPDRAGVVAEDADAVAEAFLREGQG